MKYSLANRKQKLHVVKGKYYISHNWYSNSCKTKRNKESQNKRQNAGLCPNKVKAQAQKCDNMASCRSTSHPYGGSVVCLVDPQSKKVTWTESMVLLGSLPSSIFMPNALNSEGINSI